MQKIIMPTEETKNFLEVFEMFVISQSAKGVADVTIRNYRYRPLYAIPSPSFAVFFLILISSAIAFTSIIV